MLKVGILVFTLTLSTIAFGSNVDLNKSKATWKGSKVVGSTHTGEVKIQSASVDYLKDTPKSANVVIDMSTITNTDLTDPKWNAKLVGHLKSDDFFGVKKHKTSSLKVTEIQSLKSGQFKGKGELTIKGETKKIDFTASTVKETPKTHVIKADLVFDRTDFGIKYGSGKFFDNLGDKMISDKVKVTVELHIAKGNTNVSSL